MGRLSREVRGATEPGGTSELCGFWADIVPNGGPRSPMSSSDRPRRSDPRHSRRVASSASGRSSPRRSSGADGATRREFQRGSRIDARRARPPRRRHPDHRRFAASDGAGGGGGGRRDRHAPVLVDRSGGMSTLSRRRPAASIRSGRSGRWTSRPTSLVRPPARVAPTGCRCTRRAAQARRQPRPPALVEAARPSDRRGGAGHGEPRHRARPRGLRYRRQSGADGAHRPWMASSSTSNRRASATSRASRCVSPVGPRSCLASEPSRTPPSSPLATSPSTRRLACPFGPGSW